MNKLKAGVVGATGYTGEELVRLLAHHPHAEVTYVSGNIDRGIKIQEIFPYLEKRVDLECKPYSHEEAVASADFLFLSLPHTISMQVAPRILVAGKKVVDMSADYRLKNEKVYERFYKTPHVDAQNLVRAVYGLPEVNREAIRSANLVANPGCYPTGAILGLLPGFKEGIFDGDSIQIDAKSGVTGAGRKTDLGLSFPEVNESFKAYKIFEHQHVPEVLDVCDGTAPSTGHASHRRDKPLSH